MSLTHFPFSSIHKPPHDSTVRQIGTNVNRLKLCLKLNHPNSVQDIYSWYLKPPQHSTFPTTHVIIPKFSTLLRRQLLISFILNRLFVLLRRYSHTIMVIVKAHKKRTLFSQAEASISASPSHHRSKQQTLWQPPHPFAQVIVASDSHEKVSSTPRVVYSDENSWVNIDCIIIGWCRVLVISMQFNQNTRRDM